MNCFSRKYIYLLITAVALTCSISCSKSAVTGEAPAENLISATFTKGNGDNKAYRIYLNGIDGTVTVGKEYSGTYVDNSNDALATCRVNEDGSLIDIDETGASGLRAIDGPYKMHIVYPAIKMSPITGENGINGYHFYREEEMQENSIYISQTKTVNVDGIYLKEEGGETQYIYDASSMILKQPRSKIDIIFKCGNDIASTTLQSIKLKNIINEGYYRPADSRFYYQNSSLIDLNLYNAPENVQPLLSGTSQTIAENIFLLSMDYSEKDSQGNTKWPLPSLEIKTGSEETYYVTFTAALGWNFEPHNRYEFTITINSLYVNLSVTATPWDIEEENNGTIENPKQWSIDFPINGSGDNVLDWEEVNAGTGTIG